MPLIVLSAALLVVATTLVHYEALRLLSFGLPIVRLPARARLIVAVVGAFAAHSAQIVLYALVFWGLIHVAGAGHLVGAGPAGLTEVLYFSAETFTSLGYGDLLPTGPLRGLAGVEALNGLLLIGWTASYLYMEMQRYWSGGARSN